MIYRVRVLLFFFLIFQAGCMVSKNPAAFDGLSAAYPGAIPTIAADAARHISRVYPPGNTVVSLDSKSFFGQVFEEELRKRGFSISEAGIQIEYRLDLLQNESEPVCYLSLNVPDGRLSQSYTLRDGLAIPESNFVKMGLEAYSVNHDPAPYVPTTPLDEQAVASKNSEAKPLDSVPLSPAPPAVVPSPVAPSVHVSPVSVPSVPAEPSTHASSTPAAPSLNSGTPHLVSSALNEMDKEPIRDVPLLPVASPIEVSWEIRPGMLKPQLESWTVKAGYQLIWKSETDYDMQSAVTFRDDFVGAVKRLFTRMHMQGNPIRVTVYQDNRVVEVAED